MQVLVIGSGGREHALGWKLSQSPRCTRLFFSPGNPGTAELGENLQLTGISGICEFALEQNIDLVVAGPEQPLVDGLADALEKVGVPCFGPSAWAAQLEGSKAFAKRVMTEAGVKTASYAAFECLDEALAYARSQAHPLVVKADGLAAGKGVTICQEFLETEQALHAAMAEQTFGEAGQRVIIESFLEGTEASFHVICDGERMVPLISSQDHKALLAGNQGPNTGGMGTFAPSPLISEAMRQDVLDSVCQPVLDYMRAQGHPYRGVLYAGLMFTERGVYVLEFNCRFGDPETQVILPLMDFDLLPVLHQAAMGQLETTDLNWKPGASVCVILASAGYPSTSTKGCLIKGISKQNQGQVFQAGTRQTETGLVTNGGRVLGVTAWASNRPNARQQAYKTVADIYFDGMQFREDIGV